MGVEPPRKQFLMERLQREIEAGEVDKCVIPWLGRLNEIPGVATNYSCEGHRDIGSPMSYVVLTLSKDLSAALFVWKYVFLHNAPFPVEVEFRYRGPTEGELEERVWINGDVDHIGEDCLPMFSYLTIFLKNINCVSEKGP